MEPGALSSIEPARVAGRLGQRALSSVRNMVDTDRELMAYAIVGLLADGTAFVAAATDWPDDYPCNRHMFVGMVGELARDELIARSSAIDVVNEANGFAD